MKFGIREICDVVLKAKAAQRVGNKIFYKHEPVIYFDTLKTSSLEGAATTVYAQGGRGNSRLVAWEGERTVTFTMEDALISPAGFMILSGAGLVDASAKEPIKVHTTEQTDNVQVEKGPDGLITGVNIVLDEKPFVGNGKEDFIYVMAVENGEVVTEPYIPDMTEETGGVKPVIFDNDAREWVTDEATEENAEGWMISLKASDDFQIVSEEEGVEPIDIFTEGGVVLVDYYVEKQAGAQQIDITPDKFGGNYYLEASTLFRNQDGVDMPAEFIIPNCKIQSNFTFTMASSGDPSTFTFTMDAFPDYTRFDKTKKVLAALQIIETAGTADLKRDRTASAQQSYFAE